MDLVGRTIRNIRIVEPLATGGMGELFLGRDETLGRDVVVKVIRPEHRLEAVAKTRFLREAQILSRLAHPSICQVHDYIEEEDLDFMILELIQGTTLRHRMDGGLTKEEKRALLDQIIQALVAAHSMSVVHRDLKPENIAVTPEGLVKILDFGLARTLSDQSDAIPVGSPASKATDSRQPAERTVTVFGDLLGTPHYMSPEQARGHPVTAASDMYSFGLILQEVLTEKPPYGEKLSGERLIQKALWADTAPAKGLDPQLSELLGRLQSLDPKDRPSATATAERLRWIWNKPRRRARRAMAAAVAAILVVATVVSTLGFGRARLAQNQAEASEQAALQAQAQAEAVNDFLRTMLASADPGRQGMDVTVVQVLDQASEIVEASFRDHPLSQAAVLDTLGTTYQAVGQLNKAETMLERSVEIRRERLGPEAAPTLQAVHHLAIVQADLGHPDAALELLRSTLEDCRGALGAENPVTLEVAASLGRLYMTTHEYTRAKALFEETLSIRQRLLPPGAAQVIDSLIDLGSVRAELEAHWETAEPLLLEAYRASREAFGPAHPRTLRAHLALGTLYDRLERFDDLGELAQSWVDLHRETYGPVHPNTLFAELQLAIIFVRQGEFARAEAVIRPRLETQARILGAAHKTHLESLRTLAYAVAMQPNRDDEALEIYRRRWENARKHLGEEHRVALETKSGMAAQLIKLGRLTEAEAIYREALTVRQRLYGELHYSTLRSVRALARVLIQQSRSAEAEALLQETLRLGELTDSDLSIEARGALEGLEKMITELEGE
jgi:tetratricopeptide (TPR) repeat protein